MSALDLIDPSFARELNQIRGRRPSLRGASAGSRFATPDLSPEQQEGIVGSLREKSLGTLAATGNVLDLPGSSIRDVLAGQNPLDQWLPWNWTSSENRTSGRDLARQYGMAKGVSTTGNFLGGLGAEIALDPLTYLTFGASALGKAGQAAKGAGLMDDLALVAARKARKPIGSVGKREARIGTSLEDFVKFGDEPAKRKAQSLINEGASGTERFGGLAGVGMPFMAPRRAVGQGDTALKIARGMDTAGSKVRYAKIPGTDAAPMDAAARLFDVTIHNAKTPLVQAIARGTFRNKDKSFAAGRGDAIRYANVLAKAGLSGEEFGDIVTMRAEGIGSGQLPLAVRGNIDETLKKLTPEADQAINEVVKGIRSDLDPMLPRAEQLGIKVKSLQDDYIQNYLPRYLVESAGHRTKRDTSLTSGFDPASEGRVDALRNVPGGTVAVRNMVKDPHLNEMIDSGKATVEDVRDYLRGKHEGWLSDQYKVFDKEKSEWKVRDGRFDKLAKMLSGYSPETRQAGIFGNHPVVDYQARRMAFSNAEESAKSLAEALSQPGVLKGGSDIAGAEQGVRLRTLVENSKLRWGDQKSGFGRHLKDKMGLKAEVKDLGEAMVDPAVAKDLGRMMEMMRGGEALDEWLGLLDSATNFGKGMWTSVWPAFHVRNFVSGMAWNFMRGIARLEDVKQARKFSLGKPIDDAVEIVQGNADLSRMANEHGLNVGKLTPEQATEIIAESAYANNVAGKFNAMATDVVGNGTDRPGTLMDMLQGQQHLGQPSMKAGRVARKFFGREPGTNLNPRKSRGVGGLTESEFGPMAAGEEVGHYVESMNRMAPYLNLLKKGHTPEEAARIVGETQILYQNRNFTPFESSVMKRLVPFWSFTSRISPQVGRELLEKPGGRLGASVRAQRLSQDEGGMAPDYVRETASVPVGSNPVLSAIFGTPPEGTDRYITGLGLMHEDPFSFGPDTRGAMLEGLSRTNPFVKAPLEWAAGQSFFQKGLDGGRSLDDMDPSLGRLMSNVAGKDDPVKLPLWFEQMVANSPAARAVSTARQLTDPRKRSETVPFLPGPSALMNTMTGLRITDVSPGSKDAILRELLQRAEKDAGATTFERVYFPQAELDKMTPEQREEALRLQALANVLASRAKERKAAQAD